MTPTPTREVVLRCAIVAMWCDIAVLGFLIPLRFTDPELPILPRTIIGLLAAVATLMVAAGVVFGCRGIYRYVRYGKDVLG